MSKSDLIKVLTLSAIAYHGKIIHAGAVIEIDKATAKELADSAVKIIDEDEAAKLAAASTSDADSLLAHAAKIKQLEDALETAQQSIVDKDAQIAQLQSSLDEKHENAKTSESDAASTTSTKKTADKK